MNKCKCGCGTEIADNKDFVHGHNARVDNPAKKPEVKEKISKSMTGKEMPWMKGESNPAKREEVREKISNSKKGVKNPKVAEEQRLSKEREKKRKKLYNKGLLDEEIAEKVGVSKRTINRWRNDRGLSNNREEGFRRSPETEFKEGNIPWNKGKTKKDDKKLERIAELNCNKANLEPSPKLSYIIGVVKGDGYINHSNGRNRICLSVKDYEFAEKFSNILSDIIGFEKNYSINRTKDGRFCTRGDSIHLCKLIEGEKWKEKAKKYPSEFIVGIFDSDGSVWKEEHRNYPRACIYNTKIEIINLCQSILEGHQIDTNVRCSENKGRRNVTKDGRIIVSKKEYYTLEITSDSIVNFHDFLSSSNVKLMKRKRLEKYA